MARAWAQLGAHSSAAEQSNDAQGKRLNPISRHLFALRNRAQTTTGLFFARSELRSRPPRRSRDALRGRRAASSALPSFARDKQPGFVMRRPRFLGVWRARASAVSGAPGPSRPGVFGALLPSFRTGARSPESSRSLIAVEKCIIRGSAGHGADGSGAQWRARPASRMSKLRANERKTQRAGTHAVAQ